MEIICWLTLILVAYPFTIYPASLWILTIFFAKKYRSADKPLKVSLIISSHNEEVHIVEKLNNCFSLDYPADDLEILVGFDGCTDQTADLAEPFQKKGVRFIHSKEWIGKKMMCEILVAESNNAILVFTDTNAMLEKNALNELFKPLADDSVGAVTGNLKYYPDSHGSLIGESLFKKFDNILKCMESDLFSSVIVEGSLYAIRRELFENIRPGVSEDLVLAMQLVKKKKRVIFQKKAVSFENFSMPLGNEFSRKVRISALTLAGLFTYPECLNPFRFGYYAAFLWSHRILPFLVPFFLVVSFFGTVRLAGDSSFWDLILKVQIIFYSLAIFYGIFGKKTSNSIVGKLTYPAFFFCFFNAALLVGLWDWFTGKKIYLWEPCR